MRKSVLAVAIFFLFHAEDCTTADTDQCIFVTPDWISLEFWIFESSSWFARNFFGRMSYDSYAVNIRFVRIVLGDKRLECGATKKQ